MDATRRKRYEARELIPSLQAIVNRPMDFRDPAIVPVWQRYLQHRRDPDFKRLVEHYAPVCGTITADLMRRRPWKFSEGFDVHLSDALLCLANLIRYQKNLQPDLFVGACFRWIRHALYREADARSFAGSRRRQMFRVTQMIRGRLWSQLGREPTREEMEAGIRHSVKRPEMYIPLNGKSEVRMIRQAEIEKDDDKTTRFDPVDAHAADPSWRQTSREIVKSVMKNLRPTDRRVLRGVLKGQSAVTIAKALGVSRERIRQRLNRILWEARCRADLAACLNVQPDEWPPPKLPGRYDYKNFPDSPPPSPRAAA